MKVKRAKSGAVVVELQRGDDPVLAKAQQAMEVCRIQKILVPVDFSENSKKAVVYAEAFARQFQAAVVFLHVVQVNYAYGEFGALDFTRLEREMRQGAEKELLALVQRQSEAGLKAESLVREGSPAKVIAETARELGVDLLIISTHGYTGLKHVLMGSIAEQVVRYAPCPVLVVRLREHDFVPPQA